MRKNESIPPEKHSTRISWRLVCADLGNLSGWTAGLIKTVSDLYRPDIFGATQDLRCECGALVGESHVGTVCAECGVVVESDALAARRRYIGILFFGIGVGICHHPYTGEDLLEFPIAPIGYRLGPDGQPNALGRKYAKLVALVADMNARYKTASSDERSRIWDITDPVDELLREIVGIFGPARDPDSPDTILSAFFHAIQTLDRSVGVLARCCGLRLDLSGSI